MFSDHITTNLINNTKQVEFICTWKVNDFTERTLNTGESLESSFFSEKAVGEDLKFKFCLYPRGFEHDKYLSIYLIFSSPNPLPFIFEGTFAASILDNLDKRNCEQTMTFTNKLLYPNGFHEFVKREFIINQPNKFLVDGHLKFCCHIKLSMDCLSVTINIQTLLNSPVGSDVILRAGDKNFNVHKNILCTRSPVLCNIIERCIERNNSNIIYIPDIEEDVMHEILTFIYKRNISNTSYELIKKLAPAADKYDVYGLMPLCEELLLQNILLNYAVYNARLGYTQGMSDLLSPLLAELDDEQAAFWCFAGLMQRSVAVCTPTDVDMDRNLCYLRELLRIMVPNFYSHLERHADALELLFCHRWILLCLKREFPMDMALTMWEACWVNYLTDHFHLFLCLAIMCVYADDVVAQDLRTDEMLLHFSSLAMYMDGTVILRKARGLLYHFRLLDRLPCTLAGLCRQCGPGMWDSAHDPVIECIGHEDEKCPHAENYSRSNLE